MHLMWGCPIAIVMTIERHYRYLSIRHVSRYSQTYQINKTIMSEKVLSLSTGFNEFV